MPLSMIFFGVLSLSIHTILSGFGLFYVIRKMRQIETKVENSGCWY